MRWRRIVGTVWLLIFQKVDWDVLLKWLFPLFLVELPFHVLYALSVFLRVSFPRRQFFRVLLFMLQTTVLEPLQLRVLTQLAAVIILWIPYRMIQIVCDMEQGRVNVVWSERWRRILVRLQFLGLQGIAAVWRRLLHYDSHVNILALHIIWISSFWASQSWTASCWTTAAMSVRIQRRNPIFGSTQNTSISLPIARSSKCLWLLGGLDQFILMLSSQW